MLPGWSVGVPPMIEAAISAVRIVLASMEAPPLPPRRPDGRSPPRAPRPGALLLPAPVPPPAEEPGAVVAELLQAATVRTAAPSTAPSRNRFGDVTREPPLKVRGSG